jgi:4-amino-4-deoxy-L-arabinose transferase-like glycosyltransferase
MVASRLAGRSTHETPGPIDDVSGDLTVRQYWLILGLTLLGALLLRGCFAVSDPPWHATVGIVWHDEGAWLHNARNKALFGVWQTDQWNPMYLTPVFTAFEYLSFKLFGVGLWQARLVSVLFGVISVLCLAQAVRATASRRAGLVAGMLLATNYLWVMWNRAALLETMMVSFMVLSAAAYIRAQRPGSWAWGIAAGAAAILAFFTKAAAAFFVAAIAIEALSAAWRDGSLSLRGLRVRSAGAATLAGLAIAATVATIVFVIPHWHEVRFYNWQMSVTRKPEYTVRAFVDRASWFPVLHDFFTRMWVLTLLATAGLAGLVVRWRAASPLERLSFLWIGLGCLELLVHDVGNERRLVFLIPPMVVLAALVLARERRLLPQELSRLSRTRALALAPLVLAAFYLLAGAAVRLGFLYEVRPAVRLGAAVAVVAAAVVYATWPRIMAWCARGPWSPAAAAALVAIIATGDLAQYAQWLHVRTDANHRAMVDIGRWLPPETLVHGKLANGLALENRIRPVFVGTGFGNFADRLQRRDIRYALTYTRPRPAYEGRIMLDVLAHRPWRTVRLFPVAESTSGRDEAALIEFTDWIPERAR